MPFINNVYFMAAVVFLLSASIVYFLGFRAVNSFFVAVSFFISVYFLF